MGILGFGFAGGTTDGFAQQQASAEYWRKQQMDMLQAHGDGVVDATAAMQAAFNAWAPAAEAAHAAQEATDRHYATQRLIAWLRGPDWLYLGWLLTMTAGLIARWLLQ